jgi:4-hydroxy-3-polyprenylbenzoate decarboxylase
MAYYRSLRDYIATLEARGKLVRVSRTMNKDTQIHPLVRCQFRGLPEKDRKAFLFEKVTDNRGRSFDTPVLVAAYAASREIYALGLQCEPQEIFSRWRQGVQNPIGAVMVPDGPVHQVVHTEPGISSPGGGLDLFPIPISTPGFDVAPYLTAAHWVTKDPETGIRNIGNYRGQVKARSRTGVGLRPEQHIGIHWQKCKERGVPLEAACVIGTTPNVVFAAVAKVPYGLDEYAAAGGMAGEPLELVRCKTVDLEVPAQAEIVLEGRISTEFLEMEAPFGEYTGITGYRTMNPYFEITAITHRENPIWTSIISQMPPSESTKMKQIGAEGVMYNFLRHGCNIPGIMDVAWHEMSGSWEFCVISMKKTNQSQPWQALNAAVSLDPSLGKIFVAVDEDVDARDPEAVIWALSFRMQPHLDVRITQGKSSHFDPSAVPIGLHSVADITYPPPRGTSAMLIDATRKWDYPPVSLPARPFMEEAQEIWKEMGLPPLQMRTPWHGYSLGLWTKEDEQEAELAVNGRYYETGEKRKGYRSKA